MIEGGLWLSLVMKIDGTVTSVSVRSGIDLDEAVE